MKKKILYLASMMLAFSGLVGLMPISSVAATNNKDNDNKVCEGLDSGKIDTSGDPATVTVFAPEGKLISQYCVKAGSATQEDGGPEYVVVNPPVKTITFGHSSGKDVSHYSLSFVDEGEKVANIISSVVCTDEGAKVTLDNTGNIDGKVTLNGEAITVGAGETVERTFNTGDDGLQIVLVIDGKAVYDQLWDCKAGEFWAIVQRPILKL